MCTPLKHVVAPECKYYGVCKGLIQIIFATFRRNRKKKTFKMEKTISIKQAAFPKKLTLESFPPPQSFSLSPSVCLSL